MFRNRRTNTWQVLPWHWLLLAFRLCFLRMAPLLFQNEKKKLNVKFIEKESERCPQQTGVHFSWCEDKMCDDSKQKTHSQGSSLDRSKY